MYLFFDTETTGVPKDYKAPLTDTENWPRLVQLAWILTNSEGKIINQETVIIKPEGFTIPEAASDIHKITTERAMAEGISIRSAFKVVLPYFESKSVTIVGHNVRFDRNIVGAEFLRLGWPDYLNDKPSICTMMSSTSYCKLPAKYGYKWPKLHELYQKLFALEFQGAHDTSFDIKATYDCFFELKRLGVIQG